MLNKCELRQEHISSFQEPKAQISLNRRTQIPQRTLRNSCSCLEAFPISQNNSPALPSPLPLPTDLKIGAETSPLFFFFFCVPSAWEAGHGLTAKLWGSWSSLSLDGVGSSVTLHGLQILIPLWFFSLIAKLKCSLQLGRGEIWQPH